MRKGRSAQSASAEEGASNHCIMENRSLMSQVVFDWLDEIWP